MTLAKSAPSPITSAALDRHASLAMTRSLPHRHCEEQGLTRERSATAKPTRQSSSGASISAAAPHLAQPLSKTCCLPICKPTHKNGI